MRKVFSALVLIVGGMSVTSCGTLFTASNQDITFLGTPGTKIYDNNKEIAEIGDNGRGTGKLHKSLSSKTLIAAEPDNQNTPVRVPAKFNPISIINLTNPIAWIVDLATGKCCKWENIVVDVRAVSTLNPSAAPTKNTGE